MAFRIFGSQNSPYSVKVKSYFQYKGIPNEWIIRNGSTNAEYQKYSKLPIIPLVVSPTGEGFQDSTPILEKFEAQFPQPSINPSDPMLKFLSDLLEEYGDEWGNKWMFHLRWARPIDQDVVSLRLAKEMMPELSPDQVKQAAVQIKKRMSGRGFAVGSNEKTAAIIESDLAAFLPLLEAHLKSRDFVFGARPSFADFGLGAQLYETLVDPTGGEMMKPYPRVWDWSNRCVDLKPEAAKGDFESWSSLASTLEPLFKHVGYFLNWSEANAAALASGAKEMTVDFAGKPWWQTVGGPQKYHAKSLQEIRKKFKAVSGNSELTKILEKTGCLRVLSNSGASKL